MYNNNNSSFSNLAPGNWEETIRDMLKNEDVPHTPTSIHKVPERLRVIKPEAYTPHYMGLGPYHHWRDDLYAMEAYKLIASKIVKRQDEQPPTDGGRSSFDDFVECLQHKDIPRIRASYDRHLGVDDRPLALMMVIDAIFLLQFLQVFMPSNRSYLKLWTRTSRLVDESKSAYHSILQDIMMLENQIPIFVLKRISSLDIFDEQDVLPTMLCNTCMKLSPFKLHHHNCQKNLRREPTQYVHLLDLLYYLIVPEKSCNDDSTSQRYYCCDDDARDELALETKQIKRLIACLPNIPPPKLLGNNNIKCLNNSRPCKAINMMASLVNAVIPCIPNLLSSQQEEGKSNDVEHGGSSNSCEGNDKNAPKVDEIEIPSVKELRSVGVEFCPIDNTNKNSPVESIEFDKKSRKFYLPSIRIDDNTEVIIRNLVAYEAVGIPGPLVLARYTELMNGIIDTPEDVKHLRQRKIIVSYLKKDEDVAQLWNGMSRSIRLSKVHSIDKAIKEVNEYFNNKAKVKFLRISKECMLCGWKISMLLLTLVLLVLMAIQSFCQVYKCPGALRPVTESGP